LSDSGATIAPSLPPSVAESRKPEAGAFEAQPRFQLRSVERTPLEANAFNDPPRSPWTDQNTDSNDTRSFKESVKEPSHESELKLNMDSLRPIPAPQNFDASPDWKPALLNARDQTAADPKVRTIERQPANASSYHEVRFLNSVRKTEPMPIGNTMNGSSVKATLRPISKSTTSSDTNSMPSDGRSTNTSGWSTVSGR